MPFVVPILRARLPRPETQLWLRRRLRPRVLLHKLDEQRGCSNGCYRERAAVHDCKRNALIDSTEQATLFLKYFSSGQLS